ncbi:MAG TPA: class I SAM-dependent methyltransferase [Pyrinomonadaceae bacterium]|nr:class I SAM-dependent methyltransferase [Pyrinomonadaceae bacterium]
MLRDNGIVYGAVNEPVLAQVPEHAERILDIGCGSGALGRRLKQKRACHVTGITYCESEAEAARQHLDEVLVCDLNSFRFPGTEKFDCIVCSHVLEHLNEPHKLLSQMHAVFAPRGTLIVALPNVLFWQQRLKFLQGNFEYTDGGLMDRTHYRFFDWRSARELLLTNGFVIDRSQADGSFPLSRFLPVAGSFLNRFALRVSPGFFGFQFVFVAHPNGR